MKFLLLVVLVVLVLSLIPYPVRGEHGAYNTWSRLAWCEDEYSCLHETGHSLDQRAGWVSQTEDFAEAVRLTVIVGAQNGDPCAVNILAMLTTAPDGQEPTKRELYAYLYAEAGGRAEGMPEGLRKFYEWNRPQAKPGINWMR